MSNGVAAMEICTVPVGLGDRGYDIVIGEGLLADPGRWLGDLLLRPRLALVSDETVFGLYGDMVMDALAKAGIRADRHIIPAGEGAKSFSELERLCAALLDFDIERRDLVLALGGGVVGDLTGFACAILRRGVDVVQMPTTLLSQVDSSVGGKTGINVPQGKNLIGAFHQPRRVLIDLMSLDSLTMRERRAGYAEVMKYGLIDQPDFFSWLEDHGADVLLGDRRAQAFAVAQSCRSKARVVAADEREQGQRALLNLGHTFGHALEAHAGYDGRLLHGEAVAIGCVMAFELSARLSLCPPDDAARLRQHLQKTGLPIRCEDIAGDLFKGLGADRMIALMQQDKKVENGMIGFILARGIGRAFISRDVPMPVLRDYLKGVLPDPA
ncbi:MULTISPECIES: 3-dehydroquinate synthase [unclassified Iodidimonas]|jgi:3-dehydroquinate synthase|uniref:3-dehydroquinate synthase n=1 Tax=unclassified Iodidimonas TaxID=2626145 RepID=UPI002482A05C|nr:MULTISPECIES: 3-dehydroquinate synthase [unclassified Iodidimonas]